MTTEHPRALLERLLHSIAPDVDLAGIDAGADLQEELDLDSMDFLNLVAAVCAETGFDIPETDYPQLGSLESFTSYLAARSPGG